MPTAQISLEFAASDSGIVAEKLHKRLHTHLETAGIETDETRIALTDPGARGLPDILWGVFQVSWPAALGSLTTVLSTTLIDFVKRGGRPISVRIGDKEIILPKASADEHRALLEEFLSSSTVDSDEELSR